MSEEPQHPLTHLCPACGQPVEFPFELTGAPLQCAACGDQFLIDDGEEPEEIATADEQERLDNLRITRITGLRRANYRSRSHAIIAAIACGAQMVLYTNQSTCSFHHSTLGSAKPSVPLA